MNDMRNHYLSLIDKGIDKTLRQKESESITRERHASHKTFLQKIGHLKFVKFQSVLSPNRP